MAFRDEDGESEGGSEAEEVDNLEGVEVSGCRRRRSMNEMSAPIEMMVAVRK